MIRIKKYLDWLKTEVCCACDQEKTDYIDIVPTHNGGGIALKGHDNEALPLCFYCHAEEHRGDKTFWRKIEKKTGKTRAEHVAEHQKRYADRYGQVHK